VPERERWDSGLGSAGDRAVTVVQFDDFDDDPEEWNDEEAWGDDFDCGMDRYGNCGKAGSEECDWECPYEPQN
jgi:hypothetical protein